MNISPLKKISIANVVGPVPCESIEVVMEDGTKKKKQIGIKQNLMRIAGTCNGYKKDNSQFGEFVAFKGQFLATNILTGEMFRGGTCFFPDAITDQLVAAVDANKEVEFAFDIGVKPSKTPMGYEYTIQSLIPVAENDPLVALQNRLLATAPALPAPVKGQIPLEEKKEEIVQHDEHESPGTHAASAPHNDTAAKKKK